jgi:hypothetical protein
MSGVPRELAEHKLKVYPQARPIRQKLRHFTPDKREAIRAELARLVAARFIREVLHPEWLGNPVLVLKKNKVDWRMCVDYCRRSETAGSLSRRVNVAACPSPDGSSTRASAKGGERGGRRPA